MPGCCPSTGDRMRIVGNWNGVVAGGAVERRHRVDLIKLGKAFESQIYPGEIHFFRRDIVLRDAWKRAEEFFDRTVRK